MERIWGDRQRINEGYQLWLLEQGSKTCDKYMQIFKKTARGSGYNSRSLIEKFK